VRAGQHNDVVMTPPDARVPACNRLSSGVPKALVELARLGRTLKRRAVDVLAYFDRPGTSNGPTEAINGRIEHLRGSALGFRNLTNYIARSLFETGGPQLHPRL
jgi:transposase